MKYVNAGRPTFVTFDNSHCSGLCDQYYNGAFVEKNEAVDKHLERIGYSMEVFYIAYYYAHKSLFVLGLHFCPF